jgi:hypothetical protein
MTYRPWHSEREIAPWKFIAFSQNRSFNPSCICREGTRVEVI